MSKDIKKTRSIFLAVLGMIFFLVIVLSFVVMSFQPETILNFGYFSVWAATTAIVLLCVYYFLPNFNRKSLLVLSLIFYCIYLFCLVVLAWNNILDTFQNFGSIFTDTVNTFTYSYVTYFLALNVLLILPTIIFIFFIWKKKIVPMILMYIGTVINIAMFALIILLRVNSLIAYPLQSEGIFDLVTDTIVVFTPDIIFFLPPIFVCFSIALYLSKLILKNKKLLKEEQKNSYQQVKPNDNTYNEVTGSVAAVENSAEKTEKDEETPNNQTEAVITEAVTQVEEEVKEEIAAAEETVKEETETLTEEIKEVEEHVEAVEEKVEDAVEETVEEAAAAQVVNDVIKEDKEEDIICPECQSACKPYQKFCTKCGHKLIEE